MSANGPEEVVTNFQLRLSEAINSYKLPYNIGLVKTLYVEDATFGNRLGGEFQCGDAAFKFPGIAALYSKLSEQLLEVSHKYDTVFATGPQAQPKYIVAEGKFKPYSSAEEKPYLHLLVYDEADKTYKLLYHLIDLPPPE